MPFSSSCPNALYSAYSIDLNADTAVGYSLETFSKLKMKPIGHSS